MNKAYVGRFAPSPTGHLHLGSIYVALISYLHARANRGQWLLRVDDLDPLRSQPHFSKSIVQTLNAFGLEPDGDILYQHQSTDRYQATLEALSRRDMTYGCGCSRKTLAQYDDYPGFCRTKTQTITDESAIRIKLNQAKPSFDDIWLGHQRHSNNPLGDFILLRKDKIASYTLATVLDDDWQGITHVIRGSDLVTETFKQLCLHPILELTSPKYGHLPLVLGANREKLSKQNHALPIRADDPTFDPMKPLKHLTPYLGLTNTPERLLDSPKAWLKWAIQAFKGDRIPNLTGFRVEAWESNGFGAGRGL